MRRVAIPLLLILTSVVSFVATSRADEPTTLFPFVIEKGAPDNITNVQTWSQPFDVAGSDGFLRPVAGEFVSDSGRKRLLGTNLCFGASFTTKEKAERLADTLARFGIGVVRLHHMDSRDIWGKNFDKGTTEIDPEKLERLDYLVYCLRQKGIYVNINLHVSRAFREIDGFENASQLPTQNKGVDNFASKMIEYQKKYAKDLLQHKNPYTGLRYVDDPGVAVIEINNENSVVASWSWGQLDDLPRPYCDELQRLWNQWLIKKYGTSAKLRDAWNCRTFPLSDNLARPEIVEGFDFKGPWRLESDETARLSYETREFENAERGARALHFEVEKMGDVAWRPQFGYVGLAVRKDRPYVVRFKIRADEETEIRVMHSQAHEPWGPLGLSKSIKATRDWQTIELRFIATQDDDATRVYFNGFHDGLKFDLADFSIREGGVVGMPENVSLEKGEIPVLKRNAEANELFTAEALVDFTRFLYDVENDYWQEMYRYVKGLGAKSPTTGTQLQYGFWHNQARLDYCDIHAYWYHPNFPRREWDRSDWLVGNYCLANSPDRGTLANLASLRVIGSPFTCSEYDHPYPNYYCAEGNVMLAAVAAFQDWAATFQFAWSHGDNFERQMADSFFDESAQTVKIAHLPACYAMFVRGDVKSGPGEFYYAPEMDAEKELEIMKSSLNGYHRTIDGGLDLDKSLSLAVYAGVELPDLNLPKSDALKRAKKISGWNDLPERLRSADKKRVENEFGELVWNFQTEGKGRFTVDAANTKAFSGFVVAPEKFSGLELNIGKTVLGWATVTLVKATNVDKDAERGDVLSPGRYLLTATGAMRNTNDKIVEVEGNNVTTASHFGGSEGVAPVLCEGVPATITLTGLTPDKVEVYALNNRGDRVESVEVARVESASEPSGTKFEIAPRYKTIWYELIVK